MVRGLVSIGEIAAMEHVQPKTITSYVARGQIPPPDDRIGGTPVWRRSTIAKWQAKRAARGRSRSSRTREEATS